MKKLLTFLAFALCPFAAHAQTPGAQPEICVTSPSQTANYNQLCISASAGGGAIGVTNFGTATGGLKAISTSAGPIVINPATTLQFQSNGTGIGDFGLTTAGQWTFGSSTGVGVGEAVININGANSGTATGACLQWQNAGAPIGQIGNFSACRGGAYSATLAIQSAAGIDIMSSSSVVADYGVTTGSTWTFGATVNVSTTAGITAAGVISATLSSATGTNAVCNTPGTKTNLTVQVWATGCAASSARFKEGIEAISRSQALADVVAFQAVKYRYRPEYDMGADLHVGFTAEQIGSVDPQWITYEADGVTPHAVKYQEMAPLLAAAIQQLKADNDNLRAEIELLKTGTHR
jgi:hypothetical protein